MAFLLKPKWQILAIPGGGVMSGSSGVAKVAIAVGATALATTALLGAKQYLSQDQEQKATTGSYFIYAQPGSQVSLEKPTTGSIAQEQTATATQSQPDYMQIILVGALVIGAIYILKGRK